MLQGLRPLWAEINLDNLIHNIREIKKLLEPGTEYISVVKADGYGHGASEVAHVCTDEGIKWFAVAMLDEALELRNSGIKGSILILGYTPETEVEKIVSNGISQVCFNYSLAEAMSNAAVRLGKTAKIHIAVDTGMGRIGLNPDAESADLVLKISKLPNIEIEGVFTHFSSADEADKGYTYLQFKRFKDFLNLLDMRNIKVKYAHAGNSAAIMDLPAVQMNAVRPGIIQYGLYPSDDVLKSKLNLKPVMSIKAEVVHVKYVEAGTSISYGRKFTAIRRSRIATLPVGYADGYTRLLNGKAKVIINGAIAPVVGSICMDQCMIDVTDCSSVKPGDEVIIMGSDGNLSISADTIASWMGTINYEVVCMFSKRVPRVYLKNGSVVGIKNYLVQDIG